MSNWDLVISDARVATLSADQGSYGILDDAAIGIANGHIVWLGPARELGSQSAEQTLSLDGRWLTPALVDCHTHLVFGGDRSAEFEQRLAGKSYTEIAAAGGGIASTVTATRGASDRELFDSALSRLRRLQSDGVATVEIKSGYGLNLDEELRMLEVARQVDDASDVSVVATLLAAHAIPTEHREDPDGYIDLVCEQLIPAVAERGLADAVDAYCESIAFSRDQVARVFATAVKEGLPVKLHADQLSDSGGAGLAAEFGALSADHLEYSSEQGVRALAEAGSVAVLLPGAFITLNETRIPPVALLRQLGVPIAVATDCNPGTSPMTSLCEAMALAARVFGLTPEECLAGCTRNAARALGLVDRGELAVGKRADIAVWDIEHPRDLSYWLGRSPLSRLFIAGRDATLTA